jgi:signal transduction histidine kinase/DNA-binding response OmpR family regulator
VDDRPEQRLALAALLGDLGEEVVEAASGRDALRCLLQRSFAVVLLDVDMPEMDGFETAALIRQRKSCEHTPIIFVTAYGDAALAARGYSLGAVDYILSPVDPEVLKTKVSVFLELFRKTEEANRHAASLEQHAHQLRRLADAAIAIHAARSLDELFKLVADTAASTIGAQQVSLTVDSPGLGHRTTAGGPGPYVIARPERTGLPALAHRVLADAPATPVRVARSELEGRLGPPEPGDGGEPPLRGWLAVPLASRDGGPMGWIQLSEKHSGDFTAEDEMLLLQLAQMTSIAAENTLFNEVREANQLKDQFLATLSHELRTPLQAILNWSQLLREGAPPETLAHGLGVIERNARSQSRLIEDLLDVSRIVSGKLVLERRRIDVSELLSAAVEDARPAAAERGVEIDLDVQAEAAVVGDANRLRQVLGNLFSNAIKFTPEGGRVQLTLGRDGRQAEIRMRDTGVGIPKEFLPHLFQRFRQADGGTTRAHGGLGIGLAIVRHLVELHGGTVAADSDGQGRGACFTLRLPLADASQLLETPEREPDVEPSSAERLDGVRVLLVEDDLDTRECLRLVLEQRGADVEAVGSTHEALQALDRATPHVVLSDLAMPGEDGFELIRRVRERSAEQGGLVRAAAISAHVRAEDRARAAIAGFDAHLCKPIAPSDLARAIRALAGPVDG